jgi:predicted RNA-binding protein
MDNITKLIKENLEKFTNRTLVLKKKVNISEELEYHINENLTLTNNVFTVYSKRYFDLINEVRDLWMRDLIHLNEQDEQIVMSDIGKIALFEGEIVYLDAPIEDEVEDLFEAKYKGRTVTLNKPMQGDVKKFKVFVKNEKGNVIKVNFGFGGTSAKGKVMRIKKSNPERRKNFRARHNCDNPGPKTKARYWSCRAW